MGIRSGRKMLARRWTNSRMAKNGKKDIEKRKVRWNPEKESTNGVLK
jgi:hypothetical protein